MRFVVGLVLVLSVAACASEESNATRSRDGYSIQFDSTVGADSGALRAALIALGDSLALTHFQAIVDPMGAPQRYFGFLIPPPTFGAGNVHFAVLERGDGGFRVNSLFDTRVPFGPVGVSIQAIVDADADGLLDIHYCDYRPAGEGPTPRVVGFREGAWYAIDVSQGPLTLSCRQASRR